MAAGGFAPGALIRTARGDVPVEDLSVGDIAVTSSGTHCAIKSLERVAASSQNMTIVRIAPNAFGEGKPYNNLTVASDHCLAIDVIGEVLIAASLLANGSTLQLDDKAASVVWLVVLDDHSLLLANGLPVESCRERQASDATAADPAFFGQTELCRPLIDDGPLLEAVRSQLRRCAQVLGWKLAEAPMADLHLVADGQRIEPVIRDLSACFLVPADTLDITLVSRTTRPCDVRQTSDMRVLGVYLAGLSIKDGFSECEERIAIDDPHLVEGLHGLEEGGRRWTTGLMRLPAHIAQAHPHSFFLRVDLAGPALPYWVAPESSIVADHTTQSGIA